MNKYELTNESKNLYGITLYRIRALKNFGNVQKGDLGGWIEKESNLSHFGNAWVCDDAEVRGDAWVTGNAMVRGDAKVSGDARVTGHAIVWDNAIVYDNAKVYDNAIVWDNALVFGNAWVTGNAEVCDNAKVYDNAMVCDNAMVWDNAWVFGDAKVYGDARVTGHAIATKPVKNIIGLPYNITITNKHIQIGCKQFTFKQIINLNKKWTKLKSKYDSDEIKRIEPYRKVIFELVKLEVE